LGFLGARFTTPMLHSNVATTFGQEGSVDWNDAEIWGARLMLQLCYGNAAGAVICDGVGNPMVGYPTPGSGVGLGNVRDDAAVGAGGSYRRNDSIHALSTLWIPRCTTFGNRVFMSAVSGIVTPLSNILAGSRAAVLAGWVMGDSVPHGILTFNMGSASNCKFQKLINVISLGNDDGKTEEAPLAIHTTSSS